MLWKGFQKPKRLEVEKETLTPTFGRFSAQPFERGFGTTIGNALRRILLSSIEGSVQLGAKVFPDPFDPNTQDPTAACGASRSCRCGRWTSARRKRL